MAELKEVFVPDIGGDEVQVIEICAAVGDTLAADESIITVESDKATMDIPAPFAGVLAELKVVVGDKVSEGTLIAMMQALEVPTSVVVSASATSEPVEVAPVAAQIAASTASFESVVPAATANVVVVKEIQVPDIGDANNVDVIEVLVSAGDEITLDQGLITLETDKATMEVPAPFAGKLLSLKVKVGDKVSQGSVIATIETVSCETTVGDAPVAQAVTPTEQEVSPAFVAGISASRPPVPHHPSAGTPVSTGAIHASPAVRRLAREFGIDLTQVTGSGRKGRIMKEDVQSYVKYELSRPKVTSVAAGDDGGLQVIAAPKVDFSKFGDVEEIPLSRIQKISGPNLHRNWVTIPHVTQFDEADITEMEAFRKQQNDTAAKKKADYKITPLVFMIKAVAKTLQQFPVFNSSLSSDGESLIQKKYFHIGVAVDTPNGLVVPVVRDVDKKGIIELSRELADISIRARDGKLKSADMQGSCFTISSLGGIGGTAFTPIVNYPDVAILGVSKSEIKPKWNGKEFEPKLMLPLSLSYDHRVIDGAMAARFTVALSGILSDIRTLIL